MFTAALPDARSDRRRSATALLLSLVLNASIGGVLFSMRAEAAPVTAPQAALTYVELTVPHAAAGHAPSPAAASKQPTRSVAKPVPQPITPPIAQPITPPITPIMPTLLTAADPTQIAALTVSPGLPSVAPGGSGLGPGTGIGDGPRNGEGTGSGPDAADGIREVDFSEMRVRYQFAPRYPEGALAQHLGEAICTVRLDVDTRGRPSAARVSGCPEAFAVTAEDAAMQWRFAPLMDHRTAVPGRFVIRFRFHPE